MARPATRRTITVRNAFVGDSRGYPAIVDADGTVRVWDDVAEHFTVHHALTDSQIASAQRRWATP